MNHLLLINFFFDLYMPFFFLLSPCTLMCTKQRVHNLGAANVAYAEMIKSQGRRPRAMPWRCSRWMWKTLQDLRRHSLMALWPSHRHVMTLAMSVDLPPQRLRLVASLAMQSTSVPSSYARHISAPHAGQLDQRGQWALRPCVHAQCVHGIGPCVVCRLGMSACLAHAKCAVPMQGTLCMSCRKCLCAKLEFY